MRFLPLLLFPFALIASSWEPTELLWNWGIAVGASDVGIESPEKYFSDDSFHPKIYRNVKKGDVVWVKSNHLSEFYRKALPYILDPFTLVVSIGDESFPEDTLKAREIAPFLESKKILHIFAQNVEYPAHPKIIPIPIGVDFHTIAYANSDRGAWKEAKQSPLEQENAFRAILKTLKPTSERKKKAFIDFQWNDTLAHGGFTRVKQWGESRSEIFQKLLKTHCIEFADKPLSRSELWKRKGEFAFSICPPGNGLDTHRTWEDLLLGMIVIVKKGPLDALYEGLPVVIVNDWDEISLENLERWFALYKEAHLTPQVRQKLTNAYWISQIRAKSKKLRFFNLDLHISVIADLKEIFARLGHEVVNWSLSGHTWVFHREKDPVEIVDENTWHNLDPKMCDLFYERYKDTLNQFDAFIVTHTPSFALLYEKFSQPILIVNSTRYEQPFTKDPKKWQWLNSFLKKGVAEGRIFIVSNNKADQAYLKAHTGIDSTLIPNLCLYTRTKYSGKKKGFIIHSLGDKGLKRDLKLSLGKKWHLIKNKKLKTPYEWKDLYSFQGIIHLPYQISTMTLFEEYSANVPLFVPSKKFLLSLQKEYPEQILSQLSFFPLLGLDMPRDKGNLNNLRDPEVLRGWIDKADFYDRENMPHIQYFDSFSQLQELLVAADCKKISQKMETYNKQREKKVLHQWQELLNSYVIPRFFRENITR